MTNEITTEKVQDALRTIMSPGDSGSNIIDNGAVSGIVIKDGHVGFSIDIDPSIAESAQDMRRSAEQAVLNIKGVLSATAMLTAHNAKPNTAAQHQTPQGQAQQSQAPHGQGAPLKPATHLIAVASGKGGVGKSTTSINLALALASTGKSVGILDADIYGPSLPRLLGLNRKPETSDKKLLPIEAWGLQTMSIGYLVDAESPTIWRGPMVMSALEQMLRDVAWTDLDILIIDLPPGTGDAQLTLSQRADLSGAVIVSTPQDLALIDARKGLNMFKKVNVPLLGIIENMSHFICPDCGSRHDIFSHGGARQEAEKINAPFLGEIPLEMIVRESSDNGAPIVASQPDHPISLAYKQIAAQMLGQLDAAQRPAPKFHM